MDKNQQRKSAKRRYVVYTLLCLSLIVVAVWSIVAGINESNQHRSTVTELQAVIEEKEALLQREVNQHRSTVTELQAVIEEKEALQREIERLEVVVNNGAFFQSDTEWVAEDVPYYDIKLSQELQLYTYTKCADLGISNYYELVLAMMWLESNYTPNLVSKTNDYGLMQINKVNHSWLSEELGTTDFLDPYQSIDAGTHIIASLLLKYEDPHKALMAYNYGEAGARSYWNRGTYTSFYSREVAEKQEILLNQLRIE